MVGDQADIGEVKFKIDEKAHACMACARQQACWGSLCREKKGACVSILFCPTHAYMVPTPFFIK